MCRIETARPSFPHPGYVDPDRARQQYTDTMAWIGRLRVACGDKMPEELRRRLGHEAIEAEPLLAKRLDDAPG